VAISIANKHLGMEWLTAVA